MSTAEAVAFLQRWTPSGPWVLSAIHPDRKGDFTTKAFSDPVQMTNWLEERNGTYNLYFSINPVIDATDKKPSRANVASMNWLHVDIDARAGEDLESERERIRVLVCEKLPPKVPEPTVIIFSGGGYQAYWMLKEPVKIQGDLDRAEDAKRYNQNLELLFDADSCHNIDRIMRIPGTDNIPNEQKRKKGRTRQTATLVSWNETNVYDLSLFSPVPKTSMPSNGTFTKVDIDVSGNVQRYELKDLDAWEIPELNRVKDVIQFGRTEPALKGNDQSRSAWLFYVCCALVKGKVPDDVIFSVITDPNHKISESVLDTGPNASKYARRQIKSAKEHAINPKLQELNSRFAVIGSLGGECCVVEERYNEVLDRYNLISQSFANFKNRYCNIKVQAAVSEDGTPIMKKLGDWWLHHPERTYYDGVIFAPKREIPNMYNLWKGFSCNPIPGDCNLYLDHLKNNICDGNEVYYDYLIKWMARSVQYPDRPGEVAVVLQGDRGVGKSMAAQMWGSLFGRHFMEVSNSAHLVGQFNGHLQDIVALFPDEAFFAGDKRHVASLKTLITSKMMAVERKHKDTESAGNFLHIIMASNDEHVIPAGDKERRFFMLKVPNRILADESQYFVRLVQQMEKEGGKEALLYHLLNMDISNFNVRAVPATEALQQQKLLSIPTEIDWWYRILIDGELPHPYKWGEFIPKNALLDDYLEHTKKFNVNRRATETALFAHVKKACPGIPEAQRNVKVMDGSMLVNKRTRVLKLPTLADARAAFETVYGKIDWAEAEQVEMAMEEPI